MNVNRIDGVLVQWGDRLFYGSNRLVNSRTPVVGGSAVQTRANAVRRRIQAIVVRHAPRVMVKGHRWRPRDGRDRGAPGISKSGRCPSGTTAVVRDGPEALRDTVDQWRCGVLASRAQQTAQAFNIMLSMPAGTARDRAQRGAGVRRGRTGEPPLRDGAPHPPDQPACPSWRSAWRSGWATPSTRQARLAALARGVCREACGWGIEAEASSQVARGSRHHNERLWQRKARGRGGPQQPRRLTPSRRHAKRRHREIAAGVLR